MKTQKGDGKLIPILPLTFGTARMAELFQFNQQNSQSSKKNNKYQLLYTYGCSA